MSLDLLSYRLRPATGKPDGGLVLFHGRGTDENDLFPLLDMLDPARRLVGVTPRGPLMLPPGGAHWYVIRSLGFPDPDTFLRTFEQGSRWLDALSEDTGISPEKTIVGGFSQGAVMSYAFALAASRPPPAAVIAFSGFIPTVPGVDFDIDGRRGLKVAIGHGSHDPVIGVEWGRDARDRLAAAGLAPLYREYPLPHGIDPEFVAELVPFIEQAASGEEDRVR